MALLTGFDSINAASDTFSDWLTRTNELSELVRTEIVTANSSGANTDGDAILNGTWVANTIVAADEIRGGTIDTSGALTISTNASFSANLTVVGDAFAEGDLQVSANLTVNTDTLFVGNVEAQSAVDIVGGTSQITFDGANQSFIWTSTNTHATIQTSATGSLELNADVAANGDNDSRVDIKVDSINVASFVEGGNVVFYSADGANEKLIWDATNEVLGINTTPATDVALDVAGNTHTTNLNVAQQTTSGNVVVNDELRGNTTLTITTNAEFTAAVSEVMVRNDLFVEGDAQVSSNLTVNSHALFIDDVTAEANIIVQGASSNLVFKGANQHFISTGGTEAVIRSNANGSVIIDADKNADGADTTRIDLRVDNKLSARIEDDHIAFYNTAGTAKRLYWDAGNLALGVNTASPTAGYALDVVGNTQTTDLVVTDEITANVVIVDNSLKGTANLAIVSNADFSASVVVSGNLTVSDTLSISTLDYTLVPDDYNDLIPNQTSGRLLGNTVNRWEGYFTDVDVSNDLTVSGNVDVTDTLTVDTLSVTNDASFANVTFNNTATFTDLNVSGTASFGNLEVESLVTNNAAIVGGEGTVSGTGSTVIDQFDKTTSKGFKYVIHGENGDSTSAYMLEINCSHNGTNIFFTRFGEVSNNFDAVLTPQISGANVQLVASCASASGANVHSFNVVRIETR